MLSKPSFILFKRYIDNHPHFYSGEANEDETELPYTAYRGHHPLDIPTDASRPLVRDTQTIKWDADAKHHILAQHTFIDENYIDGTPTLIASVEKINNEFPDFLDQLSTNYNLLQFLRFSGNNGMVARETQEALHEQFGTYYNALKASAEELKQVDGMGDARSNQFLDPDDPPRNKPNWAALTHCPNCDEEFWSTINEENKPSIDTIQHRTYCPNCDHVEIPTTHISEPVEFTDDTILN